MKVVFRALLAMAAVAVAGRVEAAFITGFGSPSSGTGGGTVVDFTANTTGPTSAPLTVGGVTFAPNSTGTYFINSTYGGNYNTTGNSLQTGFPGGGGTHSFLFTFASPTSAFAFNFGASDDVWLLSAFDSGGNLIESHNIAAVHASNAGDYFGIASAGIKTVTLTQTTFVGGDPDYVLIDNFTYLENLTEAVPAPPAVVLGVIGVASLLGVGRFRRKATPAIA